MKITFTSQTTTEIEQKQTDRKRREEASEIQASVFAGAGAYSAVFQRGQSDILPGQSVEKGKSLIEIQQAASNADVGISQDYMTLAANTMSEEDYARMQEEGFDFGSMDPEEAVTIVDKIKAELVRSGQHVAGYTDDLDLSALSEALGSETLARAVADSFARADIPVTEENVTAVSVAWNQASQLQPLTEGAYEYLIDNGLESEIWNLYLAQSSGAGNGDNGAMPHGAAAEYLTGGDISSDFARQIARIIEQSGLPVNEDTGENAAWLLEKGLPLTGESLNRLADLQALQLPVTEEAFVEAVTGAILSGKPTVHADLSGEPADLYTKAADLLAYYESEEIWSLSAGDLTARRQLEEIRLHMTAEVNVKLLKSSFSIDTAPMEELVEALRQAEKQLAEQYFPKDAEALDKYEVYRDTNRVVSELPGMPADILGVFAKGRQEIPLADFHGEGIVSRENYARANEQYESLMTAPRSDLGDSIKKAFANVDDILQDLGLESADENRRAVRILGYNRMEITVENIEQISTADKQVQRVIEKLTPAATLKMIRDGVNPLEKSFAELEQYFEALPQDYKQTSESYARFLYSLEKNHEITPQERESFIGVYRLVRQVEKSDGAVVGALVNAQAEIHFSNLLSAVRSGKVKNVDVRVTDALGTVAEMLSKGDSISEQIGRAYNREQLRAMRENIMTADAECVAMLQRGQISPSADNLMAARALLRDADGIWKKFINKKTNDENAVTEHTERLVEMSETSETEELWQRLEDKSIFTERYENRLQAELDAVERETFEQAEGYLDVKRMQLDHKQLTVAASLAKQEEFFLPMYVGEELAKVHITFEKSRNEKGGVDIRVFRNDGSTLQATLQVTEGSISGVFAGDGKADVMKLQQIADIFKESAKEIRTVVDIRVEYATQQSDNGAERKSTAEAQGEAAGVVDNAELYRVAKIFLQSVQGEVIYEN